MPTLIPSISLDVQAVQQVPLLDTMLEVICRVTGMGFAAVARVTETQWVACAVRDETAFGLKPGEELALETTICNEIRIHQHPVLIDHVATDPAFCSHHTPLQYGFQSYISVPIVLEGGEFFGTLCAIDPKPAIVKDVKVTGLFTVFARLIGFYLQSSDRLYRSEAAFDQAQLDLTAERKENSRYEHLTYHSLREPLRKISLYSEMLADPEQTKNVEDVRATAQKIKALTEQFAAVIRQLEPTS